MIDKLSSELKEAMRSHDSERISVLRLLISELKNKKIDLLAKGKTLTDQESLAVLTKEAKKRKDSIEAYEKAGRSDLVVEEKKELEIIESYLPEQMPREDIEKVVVGVIDSLGSDANFGVVMGKVMAQLKGSADGAIVRDIVNSKLNA